MDSVTRLSAARAMPSVPLKTTASVTASAYADAGHQNDGYQALCVLQRAPIVVATWGNDHGILGYALIKSPYPRRSDPFAKVY